MLSSKEIREIFIINEYYEDYDNILRENRIKLPKNDIKFNKKERKFITISGKKCDKCGTNEVKLYKITNGYRCLKHLRDY